MMTVKNNVIIDDNHVTTGDIYMTRFYVITEDSHLAISMGCYPISRNLDVVKVWCIITPNILKQ